jgi:hypothetical protein
MRVACVAAPLAACDIRFALAPPVRDLVFMIGLWFQSKAATYEPRFPDFLKNLATAVEVLNKGEAKATATYVDGKTIQQAIRQAGPTPE